MHKKDNYNQIYTQLINEGFLDNIGQGVLNVGKWSGKKIGQAFKWGKNSITNHKIRENLAKILKTSIENYNTHINNFNNININLSDLYKISSIQQLQKYCSEQLKNIQEEVNKNKFLFENDISAINNILPQSLFKSYLIELQNLGQKTGKFILTLKFNNENNTLYDPKSDHNIDIIKNFISQQKTIILTNLENKYLQSTISQSNLYKQIYFDIIKQETPTDTNISISNSGSNSPYSFGTSTTNPIQKNQEPSNETPNTQNDKQKELENNKVTEYKEKFNLCINKLKFYFTIISISDELFKTLFENEKIIKKILKQLKKQYNIKIQIDQLKILSAYYFGYGLLNSFEMPKFEIQKK